MRIRKNAKLSPLFFSSHASAPEVLQAHVCQLNQSPWDVIPFAASQSHQNDGEDSFTINVSLGDSINGVVDSVESMMDMIEDKDDGEIGVKNDNMFIFDEDDNNETKTCFGGNGIESSKGKKRLCCQKKDGKGWQCKKEAEEGLSFCEHHISLIRSYNNSNNNIITSPTSFTSQNDVSSKKAQTSAGARRTRATSSRTNKGSSSNPNEFYYYSGFGPLWGRRRGERGVCGDENKSQAAQYDDDDNENTVSSENTQSAQSTPQSLSSPINNEEFDYVDDDDDDDDEVSGDSGRKRMRKPIKARSLKSLM